MLRINANGHCTKAIPQNKLILNLEKESICSRILIFIVFSLPLEGSFLNSSSLITLGIESSGVLSTLLETSQKF